jgi:glycosyltransferase involved in cell wall biosynthesis
MRPVINIEFSRATLSGGYKRLYEILKRAKSEGINYIVVIDPKSLKNALKIFPDFAEIIGRYAVKGVVFKSNTTHYPVLKQFNWYKRLIKRALLISRVVKEENADMIVAPSEGLSGVLACFIASFFCHKPWTSVFQPFAEQLRPSTTLGALNPFNILSHISSKTSARNLPLTSKVGIGIDVLSLLKVSERTTILAVSNSVVEDFVQMNPRLKFITLTPGNGIDSGKFSTRSPKVFDYQGVFFARLIPEKGIFDLIEIWKMVVRIIPDAKLAICGITENNEMVRRFTKDVQKHNMSNNVKFLGQQAETELLDIITRSCLTIYPSYADSFSIVVLESLACGTPVVAYDIPAIKHIFGKCKAVFRCPIGNKADMANTILSSLKSERDPLTIEARNFASSYDWNRVARTERDAYVKILSMAL